MAQSIISILRDSGQIAYDNTSSSLTATTAQAAIDEVELRLDTVESGNTGVLDDVANLVTLSGVAVDSLNLGAFTGTILSDTETVKTALQALETSLETNNGDTAALVTLSGVVAGETELGTFSGATISDNVTIKSALQLLETAHEEVDVNVNDLISLSGVAENAANLGTFSGTIISDSTTLKGALQELETSLETVSGVTMEFGDSVLDYVVDNTAVPASEVTGNRYILSHDGGAPNAAWDGATAGDIVEFNGTTWDATTPTTGTFISADDEADVLYYYAGTWSTKAFENTTASTGLVKVGSDIRLDVSSAGTGLSFAAGVLSVDYSITGEASKAIEASALNGTGGAGLVGILDAGTLITATSVEGALAENRTAIDAIEDNTLTSTNGSLTVSGTVGGDDQVAEVAYSTTGAASRSIEASSLASTTTSQGAAMVGVEDAGGNYTATTVEGVLTEVDTRLTAVENVTSGWTVVTGALTMVSGGKYAVDTTSAAISVTLPLGPAVGDFVTIFDGGRNSETNNITVLRNSNNINSVADDIVFDTIAAASVDIVYINASIGWSVTTAG